MKRTVAAVDDNEDLLFTIKFGLSEYDKTIDVITFNNPEEFLKEANKTKFDLILLDIMMPQKNGWDTFAEITQSKKNGKTPIIFLTAKTDKQSQTLGSFGAKEFITKPFKIPELVNTIKKYV